MKKIINTCFGTTKKAILSITCVAAATAAIGGAAYASTTPNNSTGSSVIGEAQAQEYAFADAGIDAADAENIVTEYEYEDGQYIYDVEFTAENTEFEYWVSAVDGTILKKSAGVIAGTVTGNETDTTDTGTDANAGTESSAAAAEITLDNAKELALSDAGVAATDATFTQAKEDTDDGVAVYDIEFYTSSTEYEYEIRVSDGKIVDKSQEARKTSSGNSGNSGSSASASSGSTANTSSSTTTTLEGAKKIALADAGVSSGNATFTKAKKDTDDGVAVYDIEFYTSSTEYEYEIRVSDGKIVDKSQEARKTSSGSSGSSSSSYISVDKAKEIALNKAGLSASQVTFQKAMLDKEDGVVVYEVEFCKGNTEYECTINATTGAIIEFEVDTDDD